MGKGGGGNTTSYTTNIPSYAKPYVKTMLGATQEELFNTRDIAPTYGTDENGNQVVTSSGGKEITGFKEYKPYSTDLNKYVAGFSPMQEQAMRTAASPEAFGQQVQGYMSPYMQNVVDIQKREAMRGAGILGAQQQAQATNAGAFGGYREGIQRAENQRNLMTQMNDIQLKGQQMAFDNAQQQARMSQGQQMQYGGMQQQLEQQKINQAIQDYANAQQYPLMQLGTMSNMLRGLPMQAQNTNQYVAQPLGMSQVIGGVGAYSAGQKAGLFAEGGAVKSMAEGGIAAVPRYDVGGEVESQLESMDNQSLAKQAQESSSPTVRRMAQRILRERQMEGGADQSAAPAGPMGIDYQAPTVNAAKGGIIAFSKGDTVDESAAAAAQLKSDREALSSAKGAISQYLPDSSTPGKLLAAGADVATMIPRGLAGAIDTAYIRPARAMGADIGYLSPHLTPGDQASDTATPFYDRYIRSKEAKAEAKSEDKAPTAKVVAPPAAARAATPGEGVSTSPLTERNYVSRAPAPAPAAPARSGDITTAPPRRAPARPAPAKPAPADTSAADKGIVTAAPTVDANGKPVMPDFGTGPTADLKRGLWQAQQDEKIDYLAEIQKDKPENTAVEDYRKQIMAERANSAAENQRQSYMRQMQFFAKWGSTPGPVLAAGLKALDATLPDMIADQDKFKKAKRELDKAIFDIDNSIRLEEMGERKEARASKEKAKDRTKDLFHYLGTAETSVYSTNEQAKTSKYVADKKLEGDLAQVAATREGNKLKGQELNESRAFSQLLTARENYRNTIEGLEREKNKPGSQYAEDVKTLSRLSNLDKLEPDQAKLLAEVKGRVAAANVNYDQREKDAKQALKTAEERHARRDPNAPPPPANTMSPEDADALRWANDPANKNDPRAAAIKRRLNG